MTSPSGMNFEIGADATKAVNELKRVEDQAKRTQTALERVNQLPPPQMTPLNKPNSAQQKQDAQRTDLERRITNALRDQLELANRAAVQGKMAASFSSTTEAETRKRIDREITDAMRQHLAATRQAADRAKAQAQINEGFERVRYAAGQRSGPAFGPITREASITPADRARINAAQNAADTRAYESAQRSARLAELRAQMAERSARAEEQNRRLIEAAQRTQLNAEQRIAAARAAEAARIVANRIPGAPIPGGGQGGFAPGYGPAPSSGGGGGFIGNLRQGFKHGRGDQPVGYQIGQVFRTSLLYSSAFQVIRGVKEVFEDVLKEGILFQTSITELALATDRTREAAQKLAGTLADEANQYGFSGSQGVRAGTRALGVFRALDKGPGAQDAVARTSARTILQQSFLSGKDTDELTANIAAIIQAFGLGAEQIGRITDTTAFFEKQFGIAIGSLQDSMPAIASLASQSGFSIEETAGLSAAVQSRQAGTPAAASGLLSQILTREGEGNVQGIYAALGIVGDTFRERFEKLAQLLPDLSETQRGQVASAFGRGRSQSAAIGLLEELPRIFNLSKRAQQGEATGLNDEQAKMRLNDIGGQLRQFAGVFKSFSAEIGKSGLLAAVGAVALTLRELLKIITNAMEVWNTVPGAVKAVVVSLGALALASKVGAGSMLASRYTSALAASGRAGGVGAARAPGTITPGMRGAAGLAAVGLNPVAATLLGVGLAAGLVKGSFDKLQRSAEQVSDTLIIAAQTDTSNLDSVKAAMESVKKEIDARAKPTGVADRLFGGEGRAKDVEALRTVYSQLEATRKGLDQSLVNKPRGGTPAYFGDQSVASVQKGYETLRNKGFSAAESANLFAASIDKTRQSMEAAAAVFDVATAARNRAIGVTDVFTSANFAAGGDTKFAKPVGVKDIFKDIASLGFGWGNMGDESDYSDIGNSIKEQLKGKGQQIEKFFNEQYAKYASEGFTKEEDSKIANAFLYDSGLIDVEKIDKDYLEPQRRAAFTVYAEGLKKGIQGDTANARALDKSGVKQSTAFYQSRAETFKINEQRTKDLGAGGDREGSRAGLRLEIADINRAIRERGQDDPSQLILDLQEKERELAALAIERTNGLVRAALGSGKKISGSVFAQAEGNLNKSVKQAGETGNLALLETLLVDANKATIAIARRAHKKYLAAKHAELIANAQSDGELRAAYAVIAADNAAFDESAGVAAKNSATPGQKAAARASAKAAGTKSEKDDLKAALLQAKAELEVAASFGKDSLEFINAQERVNAATLALSGDSVDNSLAIAQSFNDLKAARIGGGIASAEAALKNAQLALKDAGDDILKRNQALIGIENAQNEAIEAALAFRKNKDLLGIDLTNPVQEAASAVRAAKAKLASNLANGRGKDIIAQDRLDLRQARNSKKDVAFNQFLSDEQTDLDLGRQSQSEFLRDLKSKDNLLAAEQAGLDKTSNGYRAIFDKRNQLAKLIKDASEGMDSQFNLGDIQLPTAYEARRYAQQVMGGGTGGPGAGSGAQITINGADTGQIIQILSQYMGNGNTYTVTGY